MALILSQQRGEYSRLKPQEPCHPPTPHEESRGLFKKRVHSQESVMRSKGDRILTFPSSIVSETVLDWRQQPGHGVWQFSGSAAFFLTCNYKEKGDVRVNPR